ncbi:hypothetical protein PF004_g30258 [Phytophthora fragariae]|uniref:Uncharacterized protein n=1 Tax=Phytophthora fragariae TaxID=53985 RepID=A0A6G0MDH3_9STRA|nr:hypothetical protein PF004_g30258 [Phytophthora fragariae]
MVDEPTLLRGSYREAVGPAERTRATPTPSTEQERLTALCLQPAELLTQLRERTEDEVQAIVMILNHEIEVPNVPPFLIRSMDPSELACFEDIFMALEYPLYAHLAPGQRFFANMTKGAILAQIYVGVEAAPAQKRDIENFKKTLSRITLDMDTRVVKITFKGKQSAARWSGWQMPLAGKPLLLIDYESIIERAKVTKELVLLGSYQFEVEVRKGEITSKDMRWVLTQKLGLKVQSMMHPVTEPTGNKAQQWQVRIKANGCPEEIRHKSPVVVDSAEIVLHHLNGNVNWPCRRCQSPEHPTKYCRVSEAELETEAVKYKIQCSGKLPSTLGHSSRVYAAGNHPKTMADLEALLRKDGDNQRTKTSSKRMTVGSAPKRENASKSNSTADMTGKSSLPTEWGQSVNPDAGASKEDSTGSHDASATCIGQDFGSTEETKQKMPK